MDSDRQAVDVKIPPPEQAGDAVQDTWPVVDQCDQGDLLFHPAFIAHALSRSPGFGRRIIACRSAPAGTLGYTMSSFSMTYSISTGP